MLTSCCFVLFATLFDELVMQRGQEMWREEEDSDEVRLFLASPPSPTLAARGRGGGDNVSVVETNPMAANTMGSIIPLGCINYNWQ